jgi:hypothetical protein
MAELDRAIGGFEQAAKTHAWLAGDGVNAAAARVSEASDARAAGERLGGLDLLSFVREAVQADARSADAVQEIEPEVVAMSLPHAWRHGLDDVPGWNSTTAALLVTTNKRLLRSSSGEPVGYLGRAHPVVRRALDRVRNIPVLSGSSTLDRRVAAVSGDGPALVFTFLCTVRSEAGRELERVLAVRVTPAGEPEVLLEPPQWLDAAKPNRQAPTLGLWEREFASWSEGREELCRTAAARAFEDIAEAFTDALGREIASEQKELDKWLDDRAGALCGDRASQLSFDRQLGLDLDVAGDQLDLKRTDLPAWKTGKDPMQRLGSLKVDTSVPPSLRQEADGVVQLYTKRVERLERRQHFETKLPATLGLLLVTAKGSN